MPRECSRRPSAKTPRSSFKHKKLYRSIKEELPDDTDFVSHGWTLRLSLQAVELLHSEPGAQIEVVDLHVLNPLDKDTIL
jgi:transketolase C-terminal domain/subunit